LRETAALATSPGDTWYQKSQFSEEAVRSSTKKNKDRFEENDLEIQELLAKKRSTSYAHLVQSIMKEAFRKAWGTIQRKVRVFQDVWTSHAWATTMDSEIFINFLPFMHRFLHIHQFILGF